MEAIQVFKTEFCSMENRIGNAITTELLGTFIERGTLSAHGNAGKFISDLPPIKQYLGWDGNVYPQLFIKKIEIK